MQTENRRPDHQITRFASLCLRPSARPPPPIALLLQTVTERSDPFFTIFGVPISTNCSCYLLVVAAQSAEGRKRFPVWLTAGLVSAICLFFNDLAHFNP